MYLLYIDEAEVKETQLTNLFLCEISMEKYTREGSKILSSWSFGQSIGKLGILSGK